MNHSKKDSPHQTNMPCILIVNVHSTQNAGDASLLLMNIHQLNAGFGHPSFLVSANYPEEPFFQQLSNVEIVPSTFHIAGTNQGVPIYLQIFRLIIGVVLALLFRFLPASLTNRLPGRQWCGLIRAYQRADLVVAVSGNQFLSMGRYGWPFPVTAFPIWLAHLYHKPFYVMPQSIGPCKRGWERWILKSLYSRARLVFLRDEISIDLARKIHLPSARVRFAPDPAFALPAAEREEAERILSRYGYVPDQPALGVTIIAPLARTLNHQAILQTYRDFATVLDQFIQASGARVFIFNQVTGPTPREDDRLAGRELLLLLPNTCSEVVMVDEVLSPMQLKACYACMDLMVASRLHSGIFAMGAGVATLVVGYFTKSRGLMRSMGLEEWLLEIGQLDAGQMWERLNAAWAQRRALAETTRRKADEFAAQVLTAGVQIKEDYEHGRP